MRYPMPLPAAFEHEIAGKQTQLTVLENSKGMSVALSDFGARIVSLLVPDNARKLKDVVLGFNSLPEYVQATEPYHGVSVGRFANRIAKGAFHIDGQAYQVKPNNGPNALHGGANGFHNRIWDRGGDERKNAHFHYVSADGEEGFPGELSVTVKYRLTNSNDLIISYHAETDKPTVINLTNHAFFNLNGEGNGDVLNHQLQIHAGQYLPVDEHLIPTGIRADVAGSPFDFRTPKTIGQDIREQHEQLARGGGGYDHNYILNSNMVRGKRSVATAISPATGIRMDVFSTEPAVQLYSGNFLNGKDIGKKGNPYGKHSAFCLETQHFPDSPNQPDFPSTLLLPGQVFQSETRYRFSLDN